VPAGTVIHEDERLTVATVELKHKIRCTGFLFREKPKLRKLIASKIEEYDIPYSRRKGLKQGLDYYDTGSEKWIGNEELTEPSLPSYSYAYCSDTAFHEDTIRQVMNVDVLYHEATFLEADKEKTKPTRHSTALQAATVAKQAHVKKLIIGHYSNRYKNLQPFLEEAQQLFPNTVLGEEGRRYDLDVKHA
jgi:ribonuclease Z